MLNRIDDILGSAVSRWTALPLAVVVTCISFRLGADRAFKIAFGAALAVAIIGLAPQLAEYRGFTSFRFVDRASPPVFLWPTGWMLRAVIALFTLS